MKMSINKTITTAAVGVVLSVVTLSSCHKSPYPGYDANENGVYAKFYTHDEKGVKPKEDDMVRVILSYKNNKDSILFDSKDTKFTRSENKYIEFPLSKTTFKGSFEDALGMMSIGDSASFMIPADSVYLKTFKVKELPKYIQTGTMLTFEAKLLKVTAKADVEAEKKKKMEERAAMLEKRKGEDAANLAKYLADNKITAKPTASGLIYAEKTKGKGAHPTKGCTVKVNYTGRLLDGTVFDTSDKEAAKKANLFDEKRPYEPIEFPLGMGQVIPGWDEGIMLMSPGSKGQLIIPATLAYGEQGGGPIPPYSSLVFDVELVSFVTEKAAPPQQAPVRK